MPDRGQQTTVRSSPIGPTPLIIDKKSILGQVHRACQRLQPKHRGRHASKELATSAAAGENFWEAGPLGEIRTEVRLENEGDREHFLRGGCDESDIRRTSVEGIIDTGAVTLMLPQNVVERLGLGNKGTAFVSYADERREE